MVNHRLYFESPSKNTMLQSERFNDTNIIFSKIMDAKPRARNPKASFSSICLRRPSVLHLLHTQRSSIPSKFLNSKRKVYSLFLACHRINSYYFLENRSAFLAFISILVVLLRSRDIVITVLLAICYLYFVF